MGIPVLHPAWTRPADGMTDGYSLEMTAKDRAALYEVAKDIAPETPVAITFLPNETMDARIDAAIGLRALGFEPMPHLSARRITSHDELAQMVARTTAEAGVRRVFLVAGDPPVPAGPFADTMSLIETGLFERHGIQAIGIAGHPEGHPAMNEAERWDALATKHAAITERGMPRECLLHGARAKPGHLGDAGGAEFGIVQMRQGVIDRIARRLGFPRRAAEARHPGKTR